MCPIRIPQFGKSADMREDLPTPECPESTEVLFCINFFSFSSPLVSKTLVTKTVHPKDEYNSFI